MHQLLSYMLIWLFMVPTACSKLLEESDQRVSADGGTEHRSADQSADVGAQEPVMIGGAFLVCAYVDSGEPREVGCRLEDTNRSKISNLSIEADHLLVINRAANEPAADRGFALAPQEDFWHWRAPWFPSQAFRVRLVADYGLDIDPREVDVLEFYPYRDEDGPLLCEGYRFGDGCLHLVSGGRRCFDACSSYGGEVTTGYNLYDREICGRALDVIGLDEFQSETPSELPLDLMACGFADSALSADLPPGRYVVDRLDDNGQQFDDESILNNFTSVCSCLR
jgi:hypothetical protein